MKLLNRKAPFGRDVVEAAQQLPDFLAQLTEEDITTPGGSKPVEVTLTVRVGLRNPPSPNVDRGKKKGLGMTSLLVVTSDHQLLDFRRILYVTFSVIVVSDIDLPVIFRTKSLVKARPYSLTAFLEKPSQVVTLFVHPVSEQTPKYLCLARLICLDRTTTLVLVSLGHTSLCLIRPDIPRLIRDRVRRCK